MPWIAVDSRLPSHRKLRIMRKKLGIGLHEAIGVLVTLWLWAQEDADKDGLITDANPKDMAESIRWKGDPDQLVTALASSELIHLDDKGMSIHDWAEHQGPWESYKQRQKAQRAYLNKKRARGGTEPSGNEPVCPSEDRIDSRLDKRIDGRIDNRQDVYPIHNLTISNHSSIYPLPPEGIPQRIEEAVFSWLGGLPPAVAEDVAWFMGEKGCDEELVLEAVAETRGRGVRSWDYARAVIKSSIEDGILTGEEFRTKRKAGKAIKEGYGGDRKRGAYVEGDYDWDKLAGS